MNPLRQKQTEFEGERLPEEWKNRIDLKKMSAVVRELNCLHPKVLVLE